MYKFLINKKDRWCYTQHSNMFPKWSEHVKEAILVGYYSDRSRKWFTTAAPIRVRSEYTNIKSAPVTDGELTLILLQVDPNQNMHEYAHEADEFVYKSLW